MSKIDQIISMCNTIKQKENTLNEMVVDWNTGSEADAALSDPGLQYELENEIEADIKKLREFILGD